MATASRLLCLAALLGHVSGCTSAESSVLPPAVTCLPGADVSRRTELYFGLARSGAADITEAEFQRFVDREVTPRFPDGFTVFTSQGQWRGPSGVIVREGSRVIVLLHGGTPEIDRQLDDIRAIYQTQFDQDAVMRVDSASCVSF